MAKRIPGAAAIAQAALNVAPISATAPKQAPRAQDREYDDQYDNGDDDDRAGAGDEPGCAIRQLPSRLLEKAAAVAALINPVNEPVFGRSAAVSEGVLPTPLAIAVATAKYWGPKPRTLTVRFLESTGAELRRRILSHLNAWTRTGGIRFVESNDSKAQVRISREAGGYWSYLGTDILLIPPGKPTMNLQSFSLSTPESEYKRVVRHEAGHTLGFPHEHMRRQLVARIDPRKAYDYFLRNFGWDKATVDQQVLTTLDDRTIMATPPDQDSIMCYQLPGEITRDGRPIRGGTDINSSDYAFVAKIYPKQESGASRFAAPDEDWPEEEDVDVDLDQLAS